MVPEGKVGEGLVEVSLGLAALDSQGRARSGMLCSGGAATEWIG